MNRFILLIIFMFGFVGILSGQQPTALKSTNIWMFRSYSNVINSKISVMSNILLSSTSNIYLLKIDTNSKIATRGWGITNFVWGTNRIELNGWLPNIELQNDGDIIFNRGGHLYFDKGTNYIYSSADKMILESSLGGVYSRLRLYANGSIDFGYDTAGTGTRLFNFWDNGNYYLKHGFLNTSILGAINEVKSNFNNITNYAPARAWMSNYNTGRESLYIKSEDFTPASSNGASAYLTVSSTNMFHIPDISGLYFSSTVTQYARINYILPARWNLGTITYKVVWTTLATNSGVVQWALRGVSLGDGEHIPSIAYGTAATVSDTNTQTAKVERMTAESPPLTIAGTLAEDELISFCFSRLVGVGSNMPQEAIFVGIRIYWTSRKGND